MRPDDLLPLARFGKVAAEFLHDLASEMELLRIRSQLVAEQSRAGQSVAGEAARMNAEVERIVRLFSDALTQMRGQRGHAGRFAPAEEIHAALASSMHLEGTVRLETRVEMPEEAYVAGPGTFFQRIVNNLVRNAFRHANRRVRVALCAETRGQRRGCTLRVEDDGAGIDPALRGRLFEPFARGEGGGHGLGLSSATWLAEQLGSRGPRLTDDAIQGTAFEIWFPFTESSASERRPLRGSRIVLVDDDLRVRQVLVRLLARHGADVVEMEPGAGLLDHLLSLTDLPDLLLLDQNMGNPVPDGLSLWRALCQWRPALAARTALLTGSAAEMEECTRGELPVLSKPLDMESLETLLEKVSRTNAERP